MRDPYRQEILERLAAPGLDGNMFEACAADLLRDVFPGLVPIRGGSDAGMDGAIADGEGRAFPLVCTTGRDVLGNLRGSLDSYLRRGGPRRKAVLATSQKLTPQYRQKLETTAEEKGFTLLQIIEQEGMADRLYHSPRWCKELLGLPARPSALASVPDSRRPLFDIKPLGRDKDMEWLRQTEGDRIVAGEPGSGKTFLLYKYAQEAGALFLVRSDEEAIASALLEQEPPIVIVDDAHIHSERIERLRSLRHIRGHEFSILAATWKGDVDSVSEALGTVPESRIRRLELLTRNELVEVYRQAGIEERDVGPDVLRELVTQASNKPGLAVTIATLCHQGAWPEVASGEGIRKNLVPQLERLVGPEAVSILASFGLGGARGLEMLRVSRFLGLSLADVQRKTALLAAGGVLAERPEKRLAVQPPVLRSALLRKVFFSGQGTDLPWRELVAEPEEDEWSYRSSVETIIQAAHVGAAIPRQELQDLVMTAGSERAWRDLSMIDRAAAQWAVESCPMGIRAIAEPALLQAPESVIPRLLQAAETESPTNAYAPEQPLNPLWNWVRDLEAAQLDPDEVLRRRKLLGEGAKRYVESGGNRRIGLKAALFAVSPSLESNRLDPGRGDLLTTRSTLLAPSQFKALEEFWSTALGIIDDLDAEAWAELEQALRHLIYPRWDVGGEVREEVEQQVTSSAARMLEQLVPLVHGKPGLSATLRRLGHRLALDLPVSPDPTFDLLYPENTDSPFKPTEAEEQAVAELAREWAQLNPSIVAAKLAQYEAERTWPRRTPDLARHLAALVQGSAPWIDAFVDQGLACDLIEPFLPEALHLEDPKWMTRWLRLLHSRPARELAAQWILQHEPLPAELFETAVEVAADFPFLVVSLCQNNNVPLETLRRLLQQRSEIAIQAAIGEWSAEPTGQVHSAIRSEWRSAILRSADEVSAGLEHRLEILSSDPALAVDWLIRRIEAETQRGWKPYANPRLLTEVLGALAVEQRHELLEHVFRLTRSRTWFLQKIVQRSPELYQRVLAEPSLDHYEKLAPLAGFPDESWCECVILALKAGLEASEIADASVGGSHTLQTGAVVSHWTRWDQAFATFEDHPHEGVRATVREARRDVRERIEEAEKQEHQTELHGIG